MPEPIDVETAANQPKQAMADGVSVTNHSLPDLIEAEKHVAAKAAAAKAHRGLRFTKLVPPGTIAD